MKASSPVAIDFRNTNSLWGSVLVETLHRLGLRQAIISPGSRSTPLTMAFARHAGIESIPVLDERSAAFFALGLAKQKQVPVVLLCTSGTAGANYFPAIIEAQESGVPLLVITADRPPELRDCRSGQTIDQQKLYGSHVNFYHELAVPVASEPMLRYLRQTLVHAFGQTRWPVAGPVHLNAPFRDPLAPIPDASAWPLKDLFKDGAFFAATKPAKRAIKNMEPADFPVGKRGIIVAGPAEEDFSPVDVGIIAGISRQLGWPVLADGLSSLRGQNRHLPSLITHYDSIVRSAKAGRRLEPEVVLCLGGWPTSKALRGWLEKSAPEVWLVTSRVQNLDGLHLATRHCHHGLRAFAGTVVAAGRPVTAYAEAWRRADVGAGRAIGRGLKAAHASFEGLAVREIARLLPEGTKVFVANSMPVRDVEYFWPAGERAHRIYFNRGANGIDGTLSTALGIAHGGEPALLLTGDLALLHDTNGFLLAPRFRGSLTVVLINNRGGGIFEHLPVAQFNPPFEEFFATPQEADFRKLCAAYDVLHVRVRDWRHFGRLIGQMPSSGIRVLEVRTDRKRDAAFRKKLFAAAARAAETA